MADHRTVAPNEDPVCGMTVDLAQAREKGLVTTYEGREYGFCGKGCLLEFGDDPETFLAAGFTPEM
ncbi:MAG TPA: YHS domain-containing protein [Candidatus Limnocylindrales bacterium]